MSIYRKSVTFGQNYFFCEEQTLYGSSRLGTEQVEHSMRGLVTNDGLTDEITRTREQHGDDWQQRLDEQYEGRFYERLQEAWGTEWNTRLDIVLQGNNDSWLIEQIRNESYTLQAGNKRYELANHLGNVLAVVSDKKEQSDGVTWSAVVVSAQDYFPFGMAMPGRSTGAYRYGFNGKETDPETGIQDYGMRWYLPNIARFPSVDPITKDYPWYTPYQFAGNTPIQAIDLDGLEPAGVVSKNMNPTLFYGTEAARENNLRTPLTIIQVPKAEAAQAKASWITVEQLHQINPSRSLAELQPWANALNGFAPSDFNISTPLRQAHFLAQISAETDGFRVTVEDMNKSAKRIRDSHKSMRSLSDKEINEYVGQPEKLANKVYGNTTKVGKDMGNDKEGDGYLYIGRGPIQLTGKDSYAKFTKWFQNKYNSKLDFVANPDLLCQPQYGIASALWEFGVDKKGANSAADKDNIAKVTAIINGGDNNLSGRKQMLGRAKSALGIKKTKPKS